MAFSKKTSFEAEDIEISDFAKAMAHPARVAILKLLSSRQECICGDIVSELPLSQATVSQHLKELKQAGLINASVSGPKVCYTINSAAWKRALNSIESMFWIYDFEGQSTG